MEKQKVISVIGPTAVGKTELGIELAKKLNGEVINGDSMQIYKSFNIGTAKATDEEMEGIPHHLIDMLEPKETYSVHQFKQDVNDKVVELTNKGKLPIIVGGTGFYVHAALYDFNFATVERSKAYEQKILKEIDQFGIESVYNRLKRLDPQQAEQIHPNNMRRVIRALEVIETSGKKMSDIEKDQSNEPLYDLTMIGLTMDRDLLYKRINERVDLMIEAGLVEEVKSLYTHYGDSIQPMQGIGYKEFIPYFNQEYTLDTAIELVKRNTRRFAKRQLTYYRNKIPNIIWYDIDSNRYMETFSIIIKDLEGML